MYTYTKRLNKYSQVTLSLWESDQSWHNTESFINLLSMNVYWAPMMYHQHRSAWWQMKQEYNTSFGPRRSQWKWLRHEITTLYTVWETEMYTIYRTGSWSFFLRNKLSKQEQWRLKRRLPGRPESSQGMPARTQGKRHGQHEMFWPRACTMRR